MEFHQVKSSRLEKIGYDHKSQRLAVYFKNGKVYLFEEVPGNFWTECLLADSIGKYFFDNIRYTFPYKIVS